MSTQKKDKRVYNAPLIERIQLDNEISLSTESLPPTGNGDEITKAPEYFNNDPFKTNVG